PFRGDVQTVIKGHLNGTPVPATSTVPSLPQGLDDVIGKGMSKSPDERYDTCVALMIAAREALDSRPALAEHTPTTPVSDGRDGTENPGHLSGRQTGPQGRSRPTQGPSDTSAVGQDYSVPPGYEPQRAPSPQPG